jgi:hypothetical protein
MYALVIRSLLVYCCSSYLHATLNGRSHVQAGAIAVQPTFFAPPAFAVAAGLLMLTVGALAGAALLGLQDWLYLLAQAEIIRRPEVHGFAGAEVIDNARIAEVATQANAALRMLHTHSLGAGMLALVATFAVANSPFSPRSRAILCASISLGALFPFGWLILMWLIPYRGVDSLRGPIEWLFFFPFGGTLVLGLCGTLACYLLWWVRQMLGRS